MPPKYLQPDFIFVWLCFKLMFLARYYSVMWCKASTRKHKRWEGDAVLVARGRSAVLKDMEGRDIGRGDLARHIDFVVQKAIVIIIIIIIIIHSQDDLV